MAPKRPVSSTQTIPESGDVPRHVAIIMDGNGRWATERHLPRAAGHSKGVDRVEEIVEACIVRGVTHLTLFAFSSENWRRPADEVSLLMRLFVGALERQVAQLHANGIRLRVIGDLVPLRAAAARADRQRAAAHRAQRPPDADDRGQLRRSRGHPRGGAHAARDASRARERSARDRRGGARAVSRDARRAGAGPVHPHRRRAAHQQLPAVAARLHRALLHRYRTGRTSTRANSTARSIRTACASAASAARARR